MTHKQVTRAEARNILGLMYRGQATRINGVFVEFNHAGNFIAWVGVHDEFCTQSLKQCLDYLFGANHE